MDDALKRTLPLAALLLAGPAAAVDGGFYIGGNVGSATTELSEPGIDFDDSDTAWKVYAGFHFLQFFAVEATYRDFGSPASGGVSLDPTGFDLSALAGLPVGPLYLYGRLSAIAWDDDIRAATESFSDDGTDLGIGAGVSFDLIKIRLRAEVEYFDARDGIYMYSIGGAWLF